MAPHARSTRVPAWVPVFNPLARLLLAAGVPMGPDVLITIRGRKSGKARSTPITVCENSGRRGLISPFWRSQLGPQPACCRLRDDHRWTADGRGDRRRVGPDGSS
jgi:hypothetical protein